ncbi:Hexaprenyldihydroxybenzoate methyltransferase, mitochondrial-like protein [Gossypium australe]|uniref:Hexaprenyldihydroxybenzoate methyltransferase, mitochondrial-like protein n=1 Tax=Gossypium australe TaxID=47621 RepID=A0A5B6V006_9ROSI|nr:Hexaprenyldihydroxybenzoate methyltransferase, mitochondrial-like protein [Gossypium australe]
MSFESNRAVLDEVDCNVLASGHEATQGVLAFKGQESEVCGAFFRKSSYARIDKIHKCGAEEFRGKINDDPARANYWLENTLMVLDELLCSTEDYLRCIVSLLKEEAYQWWVTLTVVAEFRKKYISQQYLEKKNKEFFELKDGQRIVAEYEREFIWPSKYTREIVSIEADMCIWFEGGLNKNI